jgi:predicted O-methyltransferase YrrM
MVVLLALAGLGIVIIAGVRLRRRLAGFARTLNSIQGETGRSAREVAAITGKLEADREASKRWRADMTEQLGVLSADSVARQEESKALAQRLVYDTVQQVEALIQLYRRVSPVAAMPPSCHWAMEPMALLALVTLVEDERPTLVVECGSGTSSVWLGYAIRTAGHGRVVSLDHVPTYAQRTREHLRVHGLEDVVEVRDAPLEALKLGGTTFQWYSLSALTDLKDIDVLVVDGPPQSVGPLARYPAVPILVDRFADHTVVVTDDLVRADERRQVARWLKEIEGLADPGRRVGRAGFLAYSRPGPGDASVAAAQGDGDSISEQ